MGVLVKILSGKKLTIVKIGPNAKTIIMGTKKYHLIIKKPKTNIACQERMPKRIKNGTGVPDPCKSLADLKRKTPKHQLRYKIII